MPDHLTYDAARRQLSKLLHEAVVAADDQTFAATVERFAAASAVMLQHNRIAAIDDLLAAVKPYQTQLVLTIADDQVALRPTTERAKTASAFAARSAH